jgi:hypothetical protein
MEYTPVTGANGGQPMTKFFTFGPDETLLLSINLDGRGEKFMPGSCVACHGGTTYNGRFPEQSTASPFLGARFLPFDTGNYLFSSKSSLSEAAQSEALLPAQPARARHRDRPEQRHQPPDQRLVRQRARARQGLRAAAWQLADAQPATAGAARFYKEVVAISCRHLPRVRSARTFDWDDIVLTPARGAGELLRRHRQHRDQCLDAERADLARPAVRAHRERRVAGGPGGEVPRLLGAAARPVYATR